eukprot:CCRYP_010509-RA/>CCRYP_010509-RA protein AED:0.04 eAED:0.04 QI:261/1/1/1/1/1/3/217/337
MASLYKLLRKLDIDGGEDSKYSEQINATEFSILKPISDLGFFGWRPAGGYTPLNNVKSKVEVLRFIDLQGRPNRLTPIHQIETPKRFQVAKDSAFENKFPYSQSDIASLHVAVQRGLDLSKIDFCFGGSALEMLATKNDSDGPYIVSRIPGTGCITIVRRKEYTKNLADVGFQFERYVTGGSMVDSQETSTVEHIHTMKVGSKTVLFCAEVDAIDSEGSVVEVKASNPRYWGTKVMFQMISSGSSKLCHGHKNRGVLTHVTMKSLSTVSREALEYADVNTLEKNLLQGMDAIQSQLKDDRKYKITFSYGVLKLVPASDRVYTLFPPDHVVASLLTKK